MTSIPWIIGWCERLWRPLCDHLWQSTAYGIIALAALALMKKNRAQVRYLIILLAGIKFLIPSQLIAWLFSLAGIHWQFYFQIPAQKSDVGRALIRLAESISPATFDLQESYPSFPPSFPLPFLFLCLWFAGIFMFFVRWFSRWRNTRCRLQQSIPILSERDLGLLEQAKGQLGIKREIGLKWGVKIEEPGVWGTRCPIIVFPAGMCEQLRDEELASIFLHELVHVRRHDNLINQLSYLLTVLYWFHPVVWILDRRLLAEQELACDEAVLEKADPRNYAAGIAKVFHWSAFSRIPGTSFASASNIARRLDRIIFHIPPAAGFFRNHFPLLVALIFLMFLWLCPGLTRFTVPPLFPYKHMPDQMLILAQAAQEILPPTQPLHPGSISAQSCGEEMVRFYFHGNEVISESRLIMAMNLPSNLLRNGNVDITTILPEIIKGAERIRQLYLDEGYVKAQVSKPLIINSEGRLIVESSILEGPLFKIGRIGFENSKVFTQQQLLDLFPLKAGDSAFGFQGKIREGYEKLKRLYENQGYLNWVPVPREEILENNALLNITFDMEEGPAFSTRQILFAGFDDSIESQIRSEFTIQEGHPFSWVTVEESLLRIQKSGLVSKIDLSNVELSPNLSNNEVDVVIHAPSQTYQRE